MSDDPIVKALDRCRVTSGKGFRLKDHDPADPAGAMMDKADAKALLQRGVERLAALQELLFANANWAMLCVFQAMDAAGKDGTIKHVMTGVNPQGVDVVPFKVPGPEDLAHDFLWRVHRKMPARGKIGIFNRSHYEEVLAVRVHPAFLERQHLPAPLTGKAIWTDRLEDIAAFEGYLGRQGIVVQKFFLNLSRAEQKRRFLDRLNEPDKNWKFSASDLAEREFWDDYMAAYEEAISETATKDAPWYVIPADQKPFARLLVVEAIIERLDSLGLKPVVASDEQKAALAAARKKLDAEQ
jgi:PPK2 family polyphosphate:nucleotide phosphotransferase